MSRIALTTVANKSKVLSKSGFSGYDACINPYVGCEFGCSYCYVRFFVKDKQKPWGEFVRVREHIEEQLPKELRKGQIDITEGREKVYNAEGDPVLGEDGKQTTRPKHRYLAIPETRLVLGTMTDPYQPKEAKFRITRKTLQILTQPDVLKFKKVGIFTRSPLVLQDLELIKQLPMARVHFTITPFPHKVMRAIEPFSPLTERRWDVVKKLKEAGLRVHVNISPVMPGMSEDFIEEWIGRLVELQVDEWFWDPMQPYKESFAAFKQACQTLPDLDWSKIEAIMTDRDRYLDWKFAFHQRLKAAWDKAHHLSPHTLGIWCDHEHDVWVNLLTGEQMDSRRYGSDLETT